MPRNSVDGNVVSGRIGADVNCIVAVISPRCSKFSITMLNFTVTVIEVDHDMGWFSASRAPVRLLYRHNKVESVDDCDRRDIVWPTQAYGYENVTWSSRTAVRKRNGSINAAVGADMKIDRHGARLCRVVKNMVSA